MIETTGEGKSAVATPDGKKPKEEEDVKCRYKKVLTYHRDAEYKRLHIFLPGCIYQFPLTIAGKHNISRIPFLELMCEEGPLVGPVICVERH